ncbi:MAG: YicC family protein [Chitinivibrionia bacterium]|nr:YicC family protein [Chitinivibrionia bacterium]
MSVQSMTGYGYYEQIFESGKYSAEIRSVNNRFIEIQCHLPRTFSALEQQIRKVLSEKLERGSVKLNVNFEAANGSVCIDYDKNLVGRYMEIFNEISQKFGAAQPKDISLLQPFFRDIIVSKPVEIKTEEFSGELFAVIEKSVELLLIERKREGASIKEFLLKSLDSISQNVGKINVLAPQRIEKYREKLQTAVNLLNKECVDEQRIALEVVLMVEKLDITEETTRLKTHISAAKKMLETENSVGKRLTFWLQEINREINTIGAKANDCAIADIVVSMKDAAEQMREQSLNLL